MYWILSTPCCGRRGLTFWTCYFLVCLLACCGLVSTSWMALSHKGMCPSLRQLKATFLWAMRSWQRLMANVTRFQRVMAFAQAFQTYWNHWMLKQVLLPRRTASLPFWWCLQALCCSSCSTFCCSSSTTSQCCSPLRMSSMSTWRTFCRTFSLARNDKPCRMKHSLNWSACFPIRSPCFHRWVTMPRLFFKIWANCNVECTNPIPHLLLFGCFHSLRMMFGMSLSTCRSCHSTSMLVHPH